ncbi:MAG: hypothetical protein IPP86_00235 [Bacteroidetes bacterium]|nr:hypothetical protein [Bacteroidota bacterium]
MKSSYSYSEIIEQINRPLSYEDRLIASERLFPGVIEFVDDLSDLLDSKGITVQLEIDSLNREVMEVTLYNQNRKFIKCIYTCKRSANDEITTSQEIDLYNSSGLLAHVFRQDDFSRITFELMLNQINILIQCI